MGSGNSLFPSLKAPRPPLAYSRSDNLRLANNNPATTSLTTTTTPPALEHGEEVQKEFRADCHDGHTAQASLSRLVH